ncbi:MAG: helix-turn-helix domain-containing protein [Bacteroidales bacterium]|nr:helix-turn-helix domain-containing protein [Bacteroidales bacterium]
MVSPLYASKTPEADRLESLNLQCQALAKQLDYQQLLPVAQEYYETASASGNKVYISKSAFSRGVALLFTGSPKEAEPYLQQSLVLGEELGNDTIAARALNCLGIFESMYHQNQRTAQLYFLEGLKRATQSGLPHLRATILSNLSQLSELSGDSAGLNYAKESFELSSALGLEHEQYFAAYFTAVHEHKLGNQEAATRWLDEAMQISFAHNYVNRHILYSLRSAICLSLDKNAEAERWAKLAIDSAKIVEGIVPAEPYLRLGQALSKQGKHQEAIVACKDGLRANEREGDKSLLKPLCETLAQEYEFLGSDANSSIWWKKALEATDSINYRDAKEMGRETSLAVEISQRSQQLRMEKQRLEAQQWIMWTLGALVLVLIVLMGYMYITHKRERRLYSHLAQTTQKAVNLEEELQSVTREAVPVGYSKKTELYQELCRLMEEERLYTNSRITRDMLAEQLGTNHSYLTEMVKENSGMSLPGFINSYRLREAIKQLSDPNHDVAIKDVCQNLGFGSMSRFYLLFKEQVGMSPSSYRKSIMELQPTS